MTDNRFEERETASVDEEKADEEGKDDKPLTLNEVAIGRFTHGTGRGILTLISWVASEEIFTGISSIYILI